MSMSHKFSDDFGKLEEMKQDVLERFNKLSKDESSTRDAAECLQAYATVVNAQKIFMAHK